MISPVSRPSYPIGTKGKLLRTTIIDTANKVFKEMGYYNTSISEIARRCNVTTAAVYRYFKNKEEILLEIKESILSRFKDRINLLNFEGLDFSGRLREMIRIFYVHNRENIAFHRMLNESELIDQVAADYNESIAEYFRKFLRREIKTGNIRPVNTDIVACALIGICYFQFLRKDNISEDNIIDLIADVMINGINGPARWNKAKDWHILSRPNPVPVREIENELMTQGEKTRQMILTSAEKIFGRLGISRTNIADITRDANVAHGTFYVHFNSKGELLEGMVKYANHLIRRDLQRSVVGVRDRRDVERIGFLVAFEFIKQHKWIFRIVPEFEMINKPLWLWYHGKLAEGYIRGLEQGIQKRQIRDVPVDFLAWYLMGFTHFISLKRVIRPRGSDKVTDEILKEVLEFMLYGIKIKNDVVQE